MKLDTLYLLDLDGSILVWKIRVHNGGAASTVTSESGQLNGQLKSHTYTVLHGKNLGKANATTHFTQAIAEAESKYAAKIKKGYRSLAMLGLNADVTDTHVLLTRLDSNRRDASGELKPMLCQKFKPNKLKYPVIGQPKINGVRAFVKMIELNHGLFGTEHRLGFTSREGLLYNIPHLENDKNILEYIKFLQDSYPDIEIILDGELYIDNKLCTDIAGAAKNKDNINNSNLYFIMFDLAISIKNQYDRILTMNTVFDNLYKEHECISAPNTYLKFISKNFARIKSKAIKSDEEARNLRDNALENGFEGCVLRDLNALYKFGQRPVTMVKYKLRDSSEFRILDIIPQDKRPELPQFILKNDLDSQTFELIGSGKHEDQEQFLINKDSYIGKFAHIEFGERTKTNLPFHCVFIGIRETTD